MGPYGTGLQVYPLIPVPDSHRLGLLVDTVYTVEKSNPITIDFTGSPGVRLPRCALELTTG